MSPSRCFLDLFRLVHGFPGPRFRFGLGPRDSTGAGARVRRLFRLFGLVRLFDTPFYNSFFSRYVRIL